MTLLFTTTINLNQPTIAAGMVVDMRSIDSEIARINMDADDLVRRQNALKQNIEAAKTEILAGSTTGVPLHDWALVNAGMAYRGLVAVAARLQLYLSQNAGKLGCLFEQYPVEAVDAGSVHGGGSGVLKLPATAFSYVRRQVYLCVLGAEGLQFVRESGGIHLEFALAPATDIYYEEQERRLSAPGPGLPTGCDDPEAYHRTASLCSRDSAHLYLFDSSSTVDRGFFTNSPDDRSFPYHSTRIIAGTQLVAQVLETYFWRDGTVPNDAREIWSRQFPPETKTQP